MKIYLDTMRRLDLIVKIFCNADAPHYFNTIYENKLYHICNALSRFNTRNICITDASHNIETIYENIICFSDIIHNLDTILKIFCITDASH